MANGSLPPKRDAHSVLVALAILSMVGFLVLYFKVDLDASLAAGDAARLSQQLANVENRLIKMGGGKSTPAAMPSAATWKTYSADEYTFSYPSTWKVSTTGGQVRFTDDQNNVLVTMSCPISEAGYEAWIFERSSRAFMADGKSHEAMLWIGKPNPETGGDNGPMNILFMNRGKFESWYVNAEDAKHSCQLLSTSPGLDDTFKQIQASVK